MERDNGQSPVWKKESRLNYQGNYRSAAVAQDKSWEYVVIAGTSRFEVGINSRKHGYAFFVYHDKDGVITAENPEKIIENSEFILTSIKTKKRSGLVAMALNDLGAQLNAGVVPRTSSEVYL